jgi:GxxExxY protein
MRFEELSERVLGCAIEVHRQLGPGLLESSYEQCLAYELSQLKIPFKLKWSYPLNINKSKWTAATE